MARATVNRVVQVAVESTKGTAPGSGFRNLPSLSFDMGPQVGAKQYRAQGYKYNTTSRIHQIWGQGSLNGPIDYNQILWPLASLIAAPTPTTPSGGTNSREWLFQPTSQGADAFKTLTIQQGDADAAEQMTYGVVTDFSLDFGLDDATMSGTVMGRNPTSIANLTASPTNVAQLPISAREVDVYMDTSAGALGTTKVTDAFAASFNIGRKMGPKWVLNTSEQSFKDMVELAPDLTASFTTEHNAQSRALYNAVASNPTKYIRIKVTGPIIEGAIPYLIQLDIAANVTGTAQEDVEGVWGYRFDVTPIHDTTMSRPFEILVRNVITAL